MTFAVRFVGFGLGFTYNFFLARTLGASGAGKFFLVLSVLGVSQIAGAVGLGNVLARHVAASVGKGRSEEVGGIYRSGMVIALAASSIVALVVFLTAPLISRSLIKAPDTLNAMRIASVAVPALALLLLHGQLLRGLQRMFEATAVQSILIPLFGTPLLVLLGTLAGLDGASVAYATSVIVGLVITRILWKRAISGFSDARGFFAARPLIDSALPLLWVEMLMAAMDMFVVFIIGARLDTTSVGIYGIASRFTALASFILEAVSFATGPRFAVLHARGDVEGLRALARNSTFILVLAGIGPLAIMILLSKQLLGLFGSDFTGGSDVLKVLAVAACINTASGANGALLMMTGHEKDVRNVFWVSAALKVLLVFVLIGEVGLLGVALSSVIVQTVTNLLMNLQVYRRLRITILPIPTL